MALQVAPSRLQTIRRADDNIIVGISAFKRIRCTRLHQVDGPLIPKSGHNQRCSNVFLCSLFRNLERLTWASLRNSRDIEAGLFCQHLAGTAGEHSHILAEALRCEFQPLDGSEIRKDRLAEFSCGHVVFKRQHDGLN